MASGSIHYKFKSAKTFDTLTFDGSFLAVSELKRLIVEKKGLGKDHACELVLVNAQDSSEYNDESALVWKNTSVIVKRVPSMKQSAVGSAIGSDVVKKVVYVAPPDTSQIPSKSQARRLQMNLNKISGVNDRMGTAIGDGANADDPLASMAREQAQQWEQEKQAANLANAGRGGGRGGRGGGRGARPDGPPGPGYICFKCNQGGHWIQDCPLAADTTVEIVRTKHAYGIPQTKLEATTGGILVAPTGESTQLVAAEDEFNKMFGFLKERGKDTLAIGAGGDENQTPLALGAGGEDADAEGDKVDEGEEVPAVPPALPPGFMPPLPPGAPPPNARKVTEPATAMPMMMDPAMMMMGAPGAVDPLDPMGIMSMDTSLEGLKKMAEELKRQQALLASGAAADVNMMLIPGLMDLPPMMTAPPVAKPAAPLPPMPAAPPPPRVIASGPPSFEDDDEDTVLTLAQGVDEEENKTEEPVPASMEDEERRDDDIEDEREEDDDNPRRRSRAKPAVAPPPPAPSATAAQRARPPPPPAHIPEDIQKKHEEAMKAAAGRRDDRRGGRGAGRRNENRDPALRDGLGSAPSSIHRSDSRDQFGVGDDANRRKPPRRAIRPGGGARPRRADSRERRPRANSRDRRAPISGRGESHDRGGHSRKRKSDDGGGGGGDDGGAGGQNGGRQNGADGEDRHDEHHPAKKRVGDNGVATAADNGDISVPRSSEGAASRPRRPRGGRSRSGRAPRTGGVFDRIRR